jgi:hypothetical protein
MSELIVNCRNKARSERPLVQAVPFVPSDLAAQARAAAREAALRRLREKAAQDEVLADLLTVLGLD